MRRPHPLRRRAFAFLLLPLVAGCSGEQVPELPVTTVHDLIDEFEVADTWQAPTEIEFASATARPFLVHGWHHRRDDGQRSTRQVSRSAEILFFAPGSDAPMPVRVDYESAQEGGIDLKVNGMQWTHAELRAGVHTLELEVPGHLLHAGENRLSIRVREPRHPTEIGWKLIRLGAGELRTPSVRRADRRLFLPFGTAIDYYLDLPSEARVLADRIRAGDEGDLVVTWTPLEGPPGRLEPWTDAASGSTLAAGAEGPGKLTFLATGRTEPGNRASGVVLVAPRIATTSPMPNPEMPGTLGPGSAPARLPNILIYMVDTLRSDHLGCYGYEKDTSPNIDRFAAENHFYPRSQANSPWTRPSAASVLTGLHPLVHGVNSKEDVLPDDALTLAEILTSNGYRTGAIVANANVAAPLGFAQGFDRFDFLINPAPDRKLANAFDVNQKALEWIDEEEEGPPFFLYLHTIDPHIPYDPPEPERSRFAPDVDASVGSLHFITRLNREKELIDDRLHEVIALYDGEIAANDRGFGELRSALEDRSLWANSIVVFVSDHGEEFFDHRDWLHGKTLYAEMLDTPLIFKLPDGAGQPRSIDRVVSHIDIVPTVLDYLGLAWPDSQGLGRSLLPMMEGGDPSWSDRSLAYLDLNDTATSVVDGEWKLIQFWDDASADFPRLYRKSSDPGELTDLAPQETLRARYLAAVTRRLERRLDRLAPTSVPEEALEQEEIRKNLEALGYL